MAVTINHAFVSAKGDGSDATLVRPSNWNASHNLNMATSKLLGRLTAGPGLVEEIPVTSYMAGLLNTADIAALAVALGLPTTGDAMLTFKTIAQSGWVLMNDGSIGDASSGATTRANADTSALFTLFYNNVNDTNAPLQTSTGAATTRAAQGAAATAFGTHCRMVLPKQLGRAIIVGGAGAGLTSRALGAFGGEESHQLIAAEVPDHTHAQVGTFAGSITSGTISGTGSGTYSGNTASSGGVDHLHALGGATGAMNSNASHSHTTTAITGAASVVAQIAGGVAVPNGTVGSIGSTNTDHTHNLPASTGAADRSLNHSHTCSGSINVTSLSGSCAGSVSITLSGNTGSAAGFTGAAHNNMQPFTAWNVMVKL